MLDNDSSNNHFHDYKWLVKELSEISSYPLTADILWIWLRAWGMKTKKPIISVNLHVLIFIIFALFAHHLHI